MLIRWICLSLLVATAAVAHAAAPTLLEQVARNWLGERNHWAFTQLVREYDGPALKQVRLERYDPSLRDVSRWRLVTINGRAPTPGEWAEWSKRKNKKPAGAGHALADHLDLAGARVVEDNAHLVRYDLPLHHGADWLFPLNKVELIVTINKTGPALEELQARLSEPFRVALGLARVLDVELDVQLPVPVVDPAGAKPTGTARAVVAKPGGRVEYVWSDFHRVTPHGEVAWDERTVKAR